MINLVKNEISKIFHKKFIYIMSIITVVFCILGCFISKVAMDALNNAMVSVNEMAIGDLNPDDPLEVTEFVRMSIENENIKLLNKYKDSKSKKHYLENSFTQYENIRCIYENKYITKDIEKSNECKKLLDDNIKLLEEKDFKYFENLLKSEKEVSIKEFEESLKDTTDLLEKKNIEDRILSNKEMIKVIDYRINNNISPEHEFYLTTEKYLVSIDNYYLNDKGNYSKDSSDDEKRTALELVSTYEKNKYKFEHKINTLDDDTSNSYLLMEAGTIIFFGVIVAISLAGTILADEFNKGTIKQLLVRPYSRNKIIISKYIAVIITLLLYLLFYFVLNAIIYGIFFGFNNIFDPVIIYNYSTNKVLEINFFVYIFTNFLATLPAYLILIGIAMFFAVITGSPALSIILPFIVFYGSGILEGLITMKGLSKLKFLYYLPVLNWNLSNYLYGGLSKYKELNLAISSIVSLVTIVLIFIFSLRIFKKKDIKNI